MELAKAHIPQGPPGVVDAIAAVFQTYFVPLVARYPYHEGASREELLVRTSDKSGHTYEVA